VTFNERNDAILARIAEANHQIQRIVGDSDLEPAAKSQRRKRWDQELLEARREMGELLDDIRRATHPGGSL